jgi:hypothetical protein
LEFICWIRDHVLVQRGTTAPRSDPPTSTKGTAMKHLLTTTGSYAAIVDLRAAMRAARDPARTTSIRPATAAGSRSLLDRLENALWRARQRDLDRYLAQAVDAVDLEDRQRRIDRSMLGRYY